MDGKDKMYLWVAKSNHGKKNMKITDDPTDMETYISRIGYAYGWDTFSMYLTVDEIRDVAEYMLRIVGEQDDTPRNPSDALVPGETLKEVLMHNKRTIKELHREVDSRVHVRYETIQRYCSRTKPSDTTVWKFIKIVLNEWGIDF